MKVGVYFCRCGGIISDKIDGEELGRRLAATGEIAYYETIELACGEDGMAQIVADLREKKPDAVVIGACSPRDHEETFRGVLVQAGMNPFMMQMVNLREHVSWVTEDPGAATDKAFHMVRGAVRRVRLHEPLEHREIEVNTDALVVGAGPAGLKAALILAEAGRKVVLVEKGPILGGMPVLYEEIFPALECGPCVLEPFMAEVMHGPHAHNIEILLLSELVEAVGSFGSFTVKIRKQPRYVNLETCIACSACIEPCPASHPNAVNCGMSERKAIDFVFYGGLPNAPYLDPQACVRSKGQECEVCKANCPVEGAIDLDEREQVLERQMGAILVAVGGTLYDCRKLPELGYGQLPGVVNSLEFERMLAGTGPTGGEIKLPDGRVPESVAIVHCVGSLDQEHNDYCSGVCCMNAFKFNVLLEHKLHGATVTHYYKTLVMPGKEDAGLYRRATGRAGTRMVPYQAIAEVKVRAAGGRLKVGLGKKARTHDMVVLMPAVVPSEGARKLAQLLDVSLDRHGFISELHGRVDATKSKVRGVYVAGTCQAPMDLSQAMTQGASAAGIILSALVPGRKLRLEVVQAVVDTDRCSGCKSCLAVCPYQAIGFDAEQEVAEVNPVLCQGCGTCVAGCPNGAMRGRHFTDKQIFAEIEGVLA